MNATQWQSLTQFVKYLGKESKCKVEETEKGWFITWINRDPEFMKEQREAQKRKKAEMDDEDRMQRFVKKQIAKAKAHAQEAGIQELTSEQLKMKNRQDGDKINASFKSKAQKMTSSALQSASGASVFEAIPKTTTGIRSSNKRKRPMSQIEQLMAETESKKRAVRDRQAAQVAAVAKMQARAEASQVSERSEPWVCKKIIVKCMAKDLAGGKFYKKKAVVRKISDDAGYRCGKCLSINAYMVYGTYSKPSYDFSR